VAGQKSSQNKKGNKKHGRNLVKCAKYRAEGRREKNKARKIAKQKKIYERAKRKREERAKRNS
jgi:hypothetical protein